jgi:hypothetical protein
MTEIRTAVDSASQGQPECWCCGEIYPADRMVNLGNHPEVHLCLRCAHFVHQRARQVEDEGKRTPGPLARDQFRNMRAAVMHYRLHERRFIGRPLRWLGSRLP